MCVCVCADRDNNMRLGDWLWRGRPNAHRGRYTKYDRDSGFILILNRSRVLPCPSCRAGVNWIIIAPLRRRQVGYCCSVYYNASVLLANEHRYAKRFTPSRQTLFGICQPRKLKPSTVQGRGEAVAREIIITRLRRCALYYTVPVVLYNNNSVYRCVVDDL